jgi:hypothetical protein
MTQARFLLKEIFSTTRSFISSLVVRGVTSLVLMGFGSLDLALCTFSAAKKKEKEVMGGRSSVARQNKRTGLAVRRAVRVARPARILASLAHRPPAAF